MYHPLDNEDWRFCRSIHLRHPRAAKRHRAYERRKRQAGMLMQLYERLEARRERGLLRQQDRLKVGGPSPAPAEHSGVHHLAGGRGEVPGGRGPRASCGIRARRRSRARRPCQPVRRVYGGLRDARASTCRRGIRRCVRDASGRRNRDSGVSGPRSDSYRSRWSARRVCLDMGARESLPRSVDALPERRTGHRCVGSCEEVMPADSGQRERGAQDGAGEVLLHLRGGVRRNPMMRPSS